MSPRITTTPALRAVRLSTAVLALAATPASAAGWLTGETPPGTLDPRSPTASADVRVTLLDDGTAVALTATAGGIVELARRSPATSRWTQLTEMGRLPRSERARPTVARTGSGSQVAAWTIDRRIWVSTRERSGRWSEPTRLTDSADDGLALAANERGAIVVAWVRDGIVEARVRERGRWTQGAPLSAGDGLARIAPSAAVVDGDGTASVGFVQDLGVEDAEPSQAIVATRAPGAPGWSVGELPSRDNGATDGPPALGVDAGGTLTAAWTSGEQIATAVRTATAAEWQPDPLRFRRSDEAVETPLLVVEASGRAVLASLAGGPGVRRLAVRNGPADAWSELRAPGAPGAAAPVAATITAAGDAIVVFAAERVGGCQMEILTLQASRDSPSVEARPQIGCEPLSLAVDGRGSAMLVGTSAQGARSVFRPANGLELAVRRPGGAVVPRGRVTVGITLSAPAQVLLRVRIPGGRVVRKVQASRPGGASQLTVDLRALPTGRYELLVSAKSGTAESPTRLSQLRLT